MSIIHFMPLWCHQVQWFSLLLPDSVQVGRWHMSKHWCVLWFLRWPKVFFFPANKYFSSLLFFAMAKTQNVCINDLLSYNQISNKYIKCMHLTFLMVHRYENMYSFLCVPRVCSLGRYCTNGLSDHYVSKCQVGIANEQSWTIMRRWLNHVLSKMSYTLKLPDF